MFCFLPPPLSLSRCVMQQFFSLTCSWNTCYVVELSQKERHALFSLNLCLSILWVIMDGHWTVHFTLHWPRSTTPLSLSHNYTRKKNILSFCCCFFFQFKTLLLFSYFERDFIIFIVEMCKVAIPKRGWGQEITTITVKNATWKWCLFENVYSCMFAF